MAYDGGNSTGVVQSVVPSIAFIATLKTVLVEESLDGLLIYLLG